MNPERWQQVEKIYHSALDVAESDRSAFIEKVCAGDAGLRREVESLLASDAEAGGFIESPALELMAEAKTDWDISSLVGRTFGTCQILSAIGSGGMGEVYKARDTRLNRNVALKILSRQLTGRTDLRQRFEREAQTLASLNHPNIASIYGLDESGGIQALVMELVEGPTLAHRMTKGPISIDEALPIARQMAEGLEYAHEKGIIHRDLKPANVKITPEGAVKLLDFGLAKALEGPPTSNSSPSEGPGEGENSPALGAATESGIILGTAAYMAPEQARGMVVDKRADIWSFGVVLYEMLTGKRLFHGETTSDTMASVLKTEPDWNVLPAAVPPAIRKLLRRCLVKERRDRLQAIGDARIEIKECLSAPIGAEAAGLKLVTTGRRREQLAWALAAAFLIAAIVSAVSYLRQGRPHEPAIIAEILPPENTQFNFGGVAGGTSVALSPDGRSLAFPAVDVSGKAMLWVRPLESLAAQPLAGTEGAIDPFWSPDSRAVGFFADGKLKTIEASGGPAVVVADAPIDGGGSWNNEGALLFVPNWGKGLYQVAGSGGALVRVIELDPSKYSHFAWPRFLPDGKHFLYGAGSADLKLRGTYFASLDGKENRLLLNRASRATYASGFLLYLRDSTLMAQTFDLEQGKLKGDPHPVAQQVVESFGGGVFDASENGALTYQQAVGRVEGRHLRWFERGGRELDLIGETGAYCDVRLSPDGRKLAFSEGDPNSEIWVNDLARGVGMRLTIDPETDHGVPVWSPDGSRILFCMLGGGKARKGIYQKPSNGAGGEELLLASETSDTPIYPTSWSSDGKFILYARGDPGSLSQGDIWVLPLAGDRKPRLFVKTQVATYDGQFSPDARWVAYTSKESGREEVYVIPFDASRVLNPVPGSVSRPDSRWQISPGGGRCPRWRRDGKEIFYLTPDNQIMAAEVEAKGNSLEARKAQPMFRAAAARFFSPYDVTPDGKRFVINTLSNTNAPLTLVVNWTARLGK